MRILILGGGTVGESIAQLLCENGHSVTVVDIDPHRTQHIYDELDVKVITGSASQSSVIFQGVGFGADICLAVTGDDETNLVAASMAKKMGVHRTIARVYGPIFHDNSTFDYQHHFQIDRLLSLEHLTANEFARTIRNPSSVAVEYFSRGHLEVKEVRISEQYSKRGVELKDLGLPKTVRVGSVKRGKRRWIATATDKLVEDDRITLIGDSKAVESIADEMQRDRHKQQKRGVVIAGGGETGYHLARILDADRFKVVLLEESPERCEFLARHLPHADVVRADATVRNVLEEERVGNADVFVACTGDDENNIIMGVEAKEIGAKKIMTLVGRPDYAAIVSKLGIDKAVSERGVMANQILGYLNSGPVISKTALPGGDILVLEVEVQEGAPCTEHVLAKLELPKECLIVAVTHGDYPPTLPSSDVQLQVGNSVVMLVHEPQLDRALEQFQAGG